MKLRQEKTFSPIAIVFETAAEAEMFWKIMREVDCPDRDERKMAQRISNLFSNEAKL